MGIQFLFLCQITRHLSIDIKLDVFDLISSRLLLLGPATQRSCGKCYAFGY